MSRSRGRGGTSIVLECVARRGAGIVILLVGLANAHPSPSDRAPQAPEETAVAGPDSIDDVEKSIGALSTPAIADKGRNTSLYPYAFYSPETELAVGAGGIITFYTDQNAIIRPSKVSLSAYVATTGQFKCTLGPQLYFAENRIFASALIDFGNYVDRFYGVGPETPDIDTAQYESKATGLKAIFQGPLFDWTTRSGFVYDISYTDIVDIGTNPYFLDEDVRGEEGGWTSGLGLSLVWDTRNHTFVPRTGAFHQVETVFYWRGLGSDYDFTRVEADMRWFFPVGLDQVFAVQAYGAASSGTPPFYDLAALGGPNRMRGYYMGRFRDRVYLAGQVEWRRHLTWKLGLAVFGGMGAVNSDLHRFRARDALVSGGAGIRYLFNTAEKVNLRVDYGIGRNTSGVYFALEEAF